VRAISAFGYQLAEPHGLLRLTGELELEPHADEVIVQVAGCGICHTDVGFAYGGVATRHPLPLVLGHEIAGRVVRAGEQAHGWLGRSVIVPAVIPCRRCAACRASRPTICRAQFMPGNDADGGFATHVRVPARDLCVVPENLPEGVSLDALSVLADAVTTPFEAIRRSELASDDVAVIIGVGGIGGFGVQLAATRGAAVIAIDVDAERLELALSYGASLALEPREHHEKELRSAVRDFVQHSGRTGMGLKIFEMSGTAAGQATAFALLDHGAYLAIVGYTSEKSTVRLSNLMALDATARGNWGCPPEQYPAALGMVLEGKVVIEPFIERHRLEDAPAVFQAVASHAIKRRVVLVPNGSSHARSKEKR
jgi:6-hydroxycyclohex-1-ene-1-carbonyl-CoA dehydrogenase